MSPEQLRMQAYVVSAKEVKLVLEQLISKLASCLRDQIEEGLNINRAREILGDRLPTSCRRILLSPICPAKATTRTFGRNSWLRPATLIHGNYEQPTDVHDLQKNTERKIPTKTTTRRTRE